MAISRVNYPSEYRSGRDICHFLLLGLSGERAAGTEFQLNLKPTIAQTQKHIGDYLVDW